MSNYELITSAIRLAPLLIMILVGLYLYRETTAIRVLANFFAGWIVMVAVTFLYWHYSIDYASTDELRYELTFKDDGAKTGSLFFGWIYSLIFVLIFEAARAGAIKANSILKKM